MANDRTTIARRLVVAALIVFAPVFAPARGEAPADPLLRLVPPDAAVTVAVEDLRGHAREFGASALADGLRSLPAVREWLTSDPPRRLRSALKKVETVLGETLPTIRDELLGEAVVLALRLPPGGRPEDARGLLLVRVPNPSLLDRLVGGMNAAQGKSGELRQVADRMHGGVTYHAREFRAARRLTEFYANLDGRVFAWSNSEELIRGAIDRQSKGAGGLADLPDVRRVRERLPRRAAASLYVDPRHVERLMAASPRPKNPDDETMFALLSRYLASVRFAGAAVEWRDGLIVHTEEVIDPNAISADWKRWAARTDTAGDTFRRVPPNALVMATGRLDFGAAMDVLTSLVPERDRPRLGTYRVALKGLLLGHDARTEVAAQIGPGMLVFVESPDDANGAWRLPAVVSLEVGRAGGGPNASGAIDNALRTVLALYALDEKHGGGALRVEARSHGAATITTLNAETPFAYAIEGGRLDIGTTAEAVARSLKAASDPLASARVNRVRSVYFPEASSFAAADLRAIHDFASGRRVDLARLLAERQHRPEPDVARDLDQVLGLIDVFDAAFLTTVVAPGFSGVHHSLGFVRLAGPRP